MFFTQREGPRNGLTGIWIFSSPPPYFSFDSKEWEYKSRITVPLEATKDRRIWRGIVLLNISILELDCSKDVESNVYRIIYRVYNSSPSFIICFESYKFAIYFSNTNIPFSRPIFLHRINLFQVKFKFAPSPLLSSIPMIKLSDESSIDDSFASTSFNFLAFEFKRSAATRRCSRDNRG